MRKIIRFDYLGRMKATGNAKEFIMANTDKTAVEYDYPQFHLSMDCFICKVKSGNLVLKEHEAAQWLTKDTLDSVEWLPADLGLIEKIKDIM